MCVVNNEKEREAGGSVASMIWSGSGLHAYITCMYVTCNSFCQKKGSK